MSTVPIQVDQVLFVTYIPVAAMVLILWDHCLTFSEEVATMWGPLNERILTKAVYLLNRYFTEAVLIYRIYVTSQVLITNETTGWLTAISAVVIASVSQFYIMMRVYRLWDHRQSVRRALLAVFGICITAAVILSTLTALSYTETKGESQGICPIESVPVTLPCAIGTLLFFNVFVILITIYNTLEKPRRFENEMLDSLRQDGARIYVAVCMLWLLLLVTSVTIEATAFVSLFALVCPLNANIVARVHLRVESLRLLAPMGPVTIYQGSVKGRYS
ncbi:uncharacterized protein ARMOST_11333 [Armillaria ostoyae]|uniref:DUF6533 domain-containing protein n=1 Tax=Armillaria ostoyae TaxID=47428 RepID=A0A284RGU3_ARMOS|nr:uncharacterized protein ARMOST_11333 [Armillaria ostoyae]